MPFNCTPLAGADLLCPLITLCPLIIYIHCPHCASCTPPGRDHLVGAREKAGTARVGEPTRPGANQATGPLGVNGHRRKGPGGAAPLYRGPRWRNEARRGRAVSAGASFGSSAASPYTLLSQRNEHEAQARVPARGPRRGLPTSPRRPGRRRRSAPRVSNTGSGPTQPARCLIERRAATAR